MRDIAQSIDRQVLTGDDRSKFAVIPINSGRRRRGVRGVGDGDFSDIAQFATDPGVQDVLTGGDFSTPPFLQTGNSGGSINWTSVLNNADSRLFGLLRLINTPRTTLVQTPQGTFYSAPVGAAPASMFGAGGINTAAFGSYMPWILGGVALIALVSFMGKR